MVQENDLLQTITQEEMNAAPGAEAENRLSQSSPVTEENFSQQVPATEDIPAEPSPTLEKPSAEPTNEPTQPGQPGPYDSGYYGQARDRMPQYGQSRLQNGNNYMPLSRAKLSNPSAPAGGYGPNGNFRSNHAQTPNSNYPQGGTYGPRGSHPQNIPCTPNGGPAPMRNYPPTAGYPTNGTYPPGGPYAPMGNNPPNGSYAPYSPVSQPYVGEKKNRMPFISLVLGILAMGVLNYFPFIALILGVSALCTGYMGLKKSTLNTAGRICGLVGLALGIISLILSVTMLVMLLSLSIRVSQIGH